MAPKKKVVNPVAALALKHKKLREEEEARIKAEQEAEERRIREEEEKEAARLKAIEDEKIRKEKEKQDRIAQQKADGTFKTKSQKEKEKKTRDALARLCLQDNTQIVIPKQVNEEIVIAKVENKYRSPIICIMGHVDVGKTKLLDNIRNTHVQNNEVGGITQQIGASFIPQTTLISRINKDIDINGLLVIDTPGHETFSNLRISGSKICDFAIVIIDIVHGLEQQTIESIKILTESNIKFIFALNKIDRLYGWKSNKNISCQELIDFNKDCYPEFKTRLDKVILQINELGLNVQLHWLNDSIEDTINICPISAITGDGIGDLLYLICQNKILYSDELQCIVLDKTKYNNNFTIDIILINGCLNVGDQIYIGNIKTRIKNIMILPDNAETKSSSNFISVNNIKGSTTARLIANDLDNVIVNSNITLTFNEVEINTNNYNLKDNGILVYSSTQGSLDALVNYLQEHIPISGCYIGNIKEKDIDKFLLSNKTDKKELLCILIFNIDNNEEIEQYAESKGIKIFRAEIIYHLFDQYIKYKNDVITQRKQSLLPLMVYPCVLQIIPKYIFNKKDPIIIGVKVINGSLHIGTPLCIPELNLFVGNIISIQHNNKDITIANTNMEVCIKIENNENQTITYGRQFDHKSLLISRLTRQSLDILKEHFREDVKNDLPLIVDLKKRLNIK